MSFVQDISSSAAVASGTSISQTITGVTAGNLLRVVVGYIETGFSRTITVSDGTSYSAANTLYYDASNSQWGVQEFYLPAASAGSHTVVATYSGATSAQFIYIQERSNCVSVNVGGTTLNSVPGASGANVVASNPITTTLAADICGFSILVNGTAPALTTGTTLAWTGRTTHTWATQASSGLMASEDLSGQSPGSYTATYGISGAGGRYLTYVVSYAPAPPSLTVNATGRNATTADPVSCTMSGVCSSGVIMAAVRTNGANPGVITISDSVNSGNYIPIGQYSVSGIGTVAILYIVVNAAGTPVVTATNPGSAGMAISCINVIGFSSTPTIDTAATQEYTGSGTTVSGTFATAFNNEVLFTMQHNGTFISGAPAGWTGAGGTDYGYYIVNASAASAPYSATLGASSSWILLSAGLYSGSGNLTGGPLPRLLYIMP